MRSIVLTFLIVIACGVSGLGQDTPRDSRYPAHWWTPVNDPKKPDWEILPQEAKPGEVILSKRNELGVLSNFAATPFLFHANDTQVSKDSGRQCSIPKDQP